MKPDINISLLFDIVEGHCEISDFTALRQLFASRLMSFFAMHPEVPLFFFCQYYIFFVVEALQDHPLWGTCMKLIIMEYPPNCQKNKKEKEKNLHMK